MHLFSHPSIHAFVHTGVHASMHLCIHRSIRPSIHPMPHVHASIHTFIQPPPRRRAGGPGWDVPSRLSPGLKGGHQSPQPCKLPTCVTSVPEKGHHDRLIERQRLLKGGINEEFSRLWMPREMQCQHGSTREQEKVPWTDPRVEMILAGANTQLLAPGWGENGLKNPRAGGASGQEAQNPRAGRCPVPCLL